MMVFLLSIHIIKTLLLKSAFHLHFLLPHSHLATGKQAVDVEIFIQYQKICVCALCYTALDSFLTKEHCQCWSSCKAASSGIPSYQDLNGAVQILRRCVCQADALALLVEAWLASECVTGYGDMIQFHAFAV